MKVVGFFTNERYEAACLRMEHSARAFGLTTISYRMEDRGAWTLNVNHKPRVILRAMQEFRDDIFYVDADAEFLAHPKLLESVPFEVAAYSDAPGMPCGGTLLFRRSNRTLALLRTWARNVEAKPEAADDFVNLVAALKEHETPVYGLPPAYNWNEKYMRKRFPTTTPVVSHYCIGAHNYKDYGKVTV